MEIVELIVFVVIAGGIIWGVTHGWFSRKSSGAKKTGGSSRTTKTK